MADTSMHEAMRDAEALGADAVAVQDLRLGWDLRLEADQFKAQQRMSVEKPFLLILSPMRLALCWTNQRNWQSH